MTFKADEMASLEQVEKHLTAIKNVLTQIDTQHKEIPKQQQAIEANINSTFKELQDHLDARKSELISHLHQMTQQKLRSLEAQRDKMETIMASYEKLRESIKSSTQADVMKDTAGRVKELTASIHENSLQPITNADMVFTASVDVVKACQHYGQVSSLGAPDPTRCHATGKGKEEAVVGETSTAFLQAVNYKGHHCEELIQSLECELVSEITGARTQCSVERRGQSRYEISYQPTIRGRHSLHVQVDGEPIRGSPFDVVVKTPIAKLGTPILTLPQRLKPSGIAFNQSGEMMVTDLDTHRVSVFSPSGEKLRSFGQYGSEPEEFNSPRGIAVDDEGNILVADYYNYRIQKFTEEGDLLAVVSIMKGPLEYISPDGIAFNSINNKLYLTDSNHQVQILYSDLTFCGAFGSAGRSRGQFNSPRGIACDSTGKVYVADSDNNRVQVFSADGQFLSMFGRRDEGALRLVTPYAIAINNNDVIYVAEFGNDRVSVFTAGGVFVTSFGGRGEEPGQFKFPCGIAVDDSGTVYVCDTGNQRVQVF